MDWTNIFQQIIVSGIVSGILIFIFQQWVLIKMKKIELNLEKEIKYRQQVFDTSNSAFKEVSDSFNELEKYLRVEIWGELRKGNFEPTKWTQVYQTKEILENNSVFLPENIYLKSNNVLDNFQKGINDVVYYMKTVKQKLDSNMKVDDEDYAKNITEKMETILTTLQEDIKVLRQEFKKTTEHIIMGEKYLGESK